MPAFLWRTWFNLKQISKNFWKCSEYSQQYCNFPSRTEGFRESKTFYWRIYFFTKGKKSIDAEKNKNVQLTHTQVLVPLIPVRTRCRLQTADQTQNVDKIPNVNCRLQNADWESKEFFVWYVITYNLTTYWSSHNCFSAISFHVYLHYCGIFLAHFLIKIDLIIISSLHIVFLLCTPVGWCDVCTDFTNAIK